MQTKIYPGTLCIRCDAAGTFTNPKTPKNEPPIGLTTKTLRYCFNDSCYLKISDYDRRNTNVKPLVNSLLEKGNVTQHNLIEMKSKTNNLKFDHFVW